MIPKKSHGFPKAHEFSLEESNIHLCSTNGSEIIMNDEDSIFVFCDELEFLFPESCVIEAEIGLLGESTLNRMFKYFQETICTIGFTESESIGDKWNQSSLFESTNRNSGRECLKCHESKSLQENRWNKG